MIVTRTWLTAVGLALAATAIAASTASADIVGNGLTVQGSTFNVAQTYALTFTIPAAGYVVSCGDQFKDSSGTTQTIAFANLTSEPAGSDQISWSPTTVGSHVLVCGAVNTSAAQSVTLGPVTVNVLPVGAPGMPNTGSGGS